jgi:N-methylhydantoinase A/oxoprolinase/acetone carboxylase beta subunit
VIAGVDTGGTFTDVVDEDGAVVKVLSNREDPARSVASGLGGRHPDLLCHGTTVATNALLERRGASVALVTNRGFADVIEIARQDRPSLYDQWADRPEPLVPRQLRLEVEGRLDAHGKEVEPVGRAPEIPDEAEAVAVCLLHADLEPAHEQVVASELWSRGLDVTTSSDVSPEFREYERTVTTVVNAYLRPVCGPYLRRMTDLAADVLVMTSAGGLMPAPEAAELPVTLLLSGPAGGVQAAAAAAQAAGFADAVSFDMGGTSTDVCLILGATPEPAPGRMAAGFPIRVPSVDIHTIGAGGGSIARIDPGGALAVGPRSAGADPGPACYGRGGTEPTVTDADLVLGRIPTDATFGDLGRLDVDAARAALDGAGVTAEGVVEVVDAAMERAVRLVSVERGVDPAGLALVAFGGAGPLHACAVAAALGMAAVVVPPRAGVLSAVGLITSPRQRELVRSWPAPADHTGVDQALQKLSDEARSVVGGSDVEVSSGVEVSSNVEVTTALDCRYAGQSHELTVPAVDDFPDEHGRRNGYVRPGAPIEVVALRARAQRPAPLSSGELGPARDREPATGPAVLAEPDCTVWIPDGWTADVGGGGAWILRPCRS